MKLNTQDIEHVAGLARLQLTPDEIERYASQLSVVFDYVEQLQEVDTNAVQETTQVTGLEDVLREDIAQACEEKTRDEIKQQFPDTVGNLLKVQAVFDNDR